MAGPPRQRRRRRATPRDRRAAGQRPSARTASGGMIQRLASSARELGSMVETTIRSGSDPISNWWTPTPCGVGWAPGRGLALKSALSRSASISPISRRTCSSAASVSRDSRTWPTAFSQMIRPSSRIVVPAVGPQVSLQDVRRMTSPAAGGGSSVTPGPTVSSGTPEGGAVGTGVGSRDDGAAVPESVGAGDADGATRGEQPAARPPATRLATSSSRRAERTGLPPDPWTMARKGSHGPRDGGVRCAVSRQSMHCAGAQRPRPASGRPARRRRSPCPSAHSRRWS